MHRLPERFPILFFFLTLLLPFPPAAFGASPAVTVSDPAPRQIAPGGFPSLVFIIKNTGTSRETFDLSLHLPKGWSAISFVHPVTLEAGGQKKKLITLSVPAATPATQNYQALLTARSTSDPGVQATGTASIGITAVQGLQLTPLPYPELSWAGKTVKYGFEIKNRGNSRDTFAVSAHSSRSWGLRISEEKVVLEPYQKKTVNVALKLPENIQQEELNMLSFQVYSVTARDLGKDIQEEAKLRIRAIPVETTEEKTYLELPGSLEWRVNEVAEESKTMPETKLRLDTGGDLNDAYSTRLHLNTSVFGDDDEVEDYVFTLAKKEAWDLTLGKTSAELSPLSRSISGTGGSITTFGERMDSTVFAGLVDDDDSTREGFGVRLASRVGEKSTLGITSSYINGKTNAEKSWAANIFGEHSLFDPLTLHAELGYGSDADEDDSDDETPEAQRALAYLAGGEFDLEALQINGELYSSPLGYPGSRDDQEGFRLYGRYQISQFLSFWALFHRYNDNVNNDPTLLTTTTDTFKLGSQLRYGIWPTLNVTWEREKEKSNDVTSRMDTDTVETDRIEDSISMELYKSFPHLTLSGRGKWGTTRESTEDGDQNVREYGATAGGSLKMFTWRLSYDRTEEFEVDSGSMETTDTLEYGLGCNAYEPRTGCSLRGDIRGSTEWNTSSDDAPTRTEQYDASLEISKELGTTRQHALGLTYEIDNITESEEREWKIGLVWRWNFDTPIPWIKTKGIIRGRIFLDTDGNGIRDAGEKIYPMIQVRLGRRKTYTNADGFFAFPPLDAGTYVLEVDMSRLPSGLLPTIALPHTVELNKGDTMAVAIPLAQIGTIRGTVFDDANRDTQHGDGEDGLSPIRIVLVHKDKEIQEGFTDARGNYQLSDIEPGEYEVKIDTRYLPRRYHTTTPETVTVRVHSREEISGVDFGAYKKPRTIIKTFFKKK